MFKGGASDSKKQDGRASSASPTKGAKSVAVKAASGAKAKQADSRDSKVGAKGSASGGHYGN